jgi:type I restriction enzyme M protein
MMSQLTAPTRDIVAKLWNLCNILRDDGVSYHQYVTELTYLLFLKMLAETGRETILPEQYRWRTLTTLEGEAQLVHYKRTLLDLGTTAQDPCTQAIFADAQTFLRRPTNLKALTKAMDGLDWFSARSDGLGDLYEGLLQKNAEEKKSGAGQYFTPRALIDSIVRVVQPKHGEVIQDPAAGTGGFLVAAHEYIKARTDDLFDLGALAQHRQRSQVYTGLELVPDAHRLCLMNLMLHGIDPDPRHTVRCGDTLSPDGETLPRADVILSNPPFGTKKGGGRPTRADFSITADTSNKQLAFVEHFYRSLKPGGRAAVVLPDNVLFEDNTGRRLRTEWLSRCNVHTMLRLPTGIFYAQGVKTNVVFFTRAAHETDRDQTQAVWVYDMRANAPSYGKTRQLTPQDFAEFEACYGDDPYGLAPRQDQGESGRFRRFDRAWIAQQRNDNLDIAWLRDDSQNPEDDLSEPEELAAAILTHLRNALEEIEALSEALGQEATPALPAADAETVGV